MGGAVTQVAGNDISHSKNERPVQCNKDQTLELVVSHQKACILKARLLLVKAVVIPI